MKPPPWTRDSEPDKWVSAPFAARFYFKRSLVTLYRHIKEGVLEKQGIPTFWDGKRWFIRLPILIAPIQKRRSRQSNNLPV